MVNTGPCKRTSPLCLVRPSVDPLSRVLTVLRKLIPPEAADSARLSAHVMATCVAHIKKLSSSGHDQGPEVRQDLIADIEGQALWAERIAQAARRAIA